MRLVQVALHADDLDRATRFYRDVIGLAHLATFDPPGLVFFDLDGVRLLLERGAPSGLVYLAVDDLVATLQRWESAGVQVETPPHELYAHQDDALGPAGTVEWMAFVRDSEANLVGLVEHRRPT